MHSLIISDCQTYYRLPHKPHTHTHCQTHRHTKYLHNDVSYGPLQFADEAREEQKPFQI